MARINWNPLQQNQVNIGLLDQAFQARQNAIGGIGQALLNIGNEYRANNTNDALMQILATASPEELATQRTVLADTTAQQGRGIDGLKVMEALAMQGDALTRRANAQLGLQQNQFNYDQAQQGVADQQVMNTALANVLSGNTAAAQEAFSQIQGNASPLFSAIRGEQRYADEKALQQARDAESKRRWEAGFGLQQQSNDRANLSSAIQASQYLNPNAGQSTTEAVYDPNTGEWNYVQSTNPSQAETLSSVMGNLFQTESNGVHRRADGSLTRSPRGALGIAQIMPATAAKPGYGMKPIDLQNTTPEQQQAWATDYITRIGKAHNFSVPQAVAAYNAGPGAVTKAIDKANAKGGSGNFIDYLPAETRAYVPKVLGNDWSRMSGTSMKDFAAGSTVQKEYNIPKTVARQVNTIQQATGIPINAKAVMAAKNEYAQAVKNLPGMQADLPESPLKAKGSLDNWILKNRTDEKNSNFFTRSFNMTDADDLLSTANKNEAFQKLNTTNKIKILDTLMDYSKGNQGLLWKNPGDFDARINQMILEDRQVTQAAQDAQRMKLLDTQASKIMAAAGVPPGTIPTQDIYALLDPEWAKKKGKATGKINNPFQ